MPSNAYDAKGLMIQAIRDDNPVVFMYHKGIMGLSWMSYFEGSTNEVPPSPTPFPSARRRSSAREDVTIVTLSQMVQKSVLAADKLAAEGIEAEVVDLRTSGAARQGNGAAFGGQDRPPAGRRRGLSVLRVSPAKSPRSSPSSSTTLKLKAPVRPPGGTRCRSLQPPARAVRHSTGGQDCRRWARPSANRPLTERENHDRYRSG